MFVQHIQVNWTRVRYINCFIMNVWKYTKYTNKFITSIERRKIVRRTEKIFSKYPYVERRFGNSNICSVSEDISTGCSSSATRSNIDMHAYGTRHVYILASTARQVAGINLSVRNSVNRWIRWELPTTFLKHVCTVCNLWPVCSTSSTSTFQLDKQANKYKTSRW